MRARPNDELRHEWRLSLEQRLGLAPSTVAAKLKSLADFEAFTGRRRFPDLRRDDVAAFKEHLLSAESQATGKRLARSSIVHKLEDCGDFFGWLSRTRDGRRLDLDAVSWFPPSRADRERARATTSRAVPSLADARTAFARMPAGTLCERRDRAVFATLLITAIRADALASLTLGTVDLAAGAIRQDARVVRTKFSKSSMVWFMPFAPEARPVLESWIAELVGFGLGNSDALFPRDTELQLLADGRRLPHGSFPRWSGSAQVRAIVRGAFRSADLDPHAPHAFRHMLMRHVHALVPSVEEFLAVSLNLGHNRLETTLEHYGRPDDERRRVLIAGLGRSSRGTSRGGLTAFLERFARRRPDLAAELMNELACDGTNAPETDGAPQIASGHRPPNAPNGV